MVENNLLLIWYLHNITMFIHGLVNQVFHWAADWWSPHAGPL
jgi:hypothetical protein